MALVGYVVAGTAEMGLIRAFSPSERELAWVSDVLLSAALGVAVYLWRHLSVTRRALARSRAQRTRADDTAGYRRRSAAPPPAGVAGPTATSALNGRPPCDRAGMIGGDFYDVVTLPPGGQSLVLVADVSGKGIPAAMALSTLRALFRRPWRSRPTGRQALMTSLSSALFEQWTGHAVHHRNRRPHRRASRARITYANAAHPAGLVVGPRGTRTLESLGPPAALLPETTYGERSLPMRAGRCLRTGERRRHRGDGRSGTAAPWSRQSHA